MSLTIYNIVGGIKTAPNRRVGLSTRPNICCCQQAAVRVVDQTRS